jgi:hypothetical protein
VAVVERRFVADRIAVASKAVDKIAMLVELLGAEPFGRRVLSVEAAVTMQTDVHHATVIAEIARSQHVALTGFAMDDQKGHLGGMAHHIVGSSS